MLTQVLLAVLSLQGEPDKPKNETDKHVTEAEVICDRGFAAVDEAKKATGKAQIEAWERAVAEFRKVAKDYSDTRFHGMCRYNAGLVLCNGLERYREAIGEFEALIASNVDDKDGTGELMHPYRNYRYNAWRMITSCYEELKQPAHAVQAVLGARDAYVSDCGTCQQQMLEGTRDKLVGLLQGLAPAALEADVTENLPEHAMDRGQPAAPGLLFAIGMRLLRRDKALDRRRILAALAAEYPASDAGKAAAKALAVDKDAKGR